MYETQAMTHIQI